MASAAQGEGGFIEPAPGFLPAIAGRCRRDGALLVADDIQTGFCRTGNWFACEHESVVPLVIDDALVDEGLDILEEAITAELG